MEYRPTWLPDLVLLADANGNWDDYLELIYDYFKTDFIQNRPLFEGKNLALKRHPLSNGKEATFWHFISEGNEEDKRIPDLRRCERIRWPKPIIENSSDDRIKVWRNERKGETRICLWVESQEYLVILADRRGYILPWTAYPVTLSHRKRKLKKEYEDFLEKQKAGKG